MSPANVLLFWARPSEYGWSRFKELSSETQEQIVDLTEGMLLDLSEQCAGVMGTRVAIYETDQCRLTRREKLPSTVESSVQNVETLHERIVEVVSEIYKNDVSAVVVVFLSISPLFPTRRLRWALELLTMEDDVIVTAIDSDDRVSVVATKSFHPSAYTSVRSLSEAGAFLVPLRAVKHISDLADMVYLRHEIIRRLLLAQFVPARTLGVLKRMQRHGIIPEES